MSVETWLQKMKTCYQAEEYKRAWRFAFITKQFCFWDLRSVLCERKRFLGDRSSLALCFRVGHLCCLWFASAKIMDPWRIYRCVFGGFMVVRVRLARIEITEVVRVASATKRSVEAILAAVLWWDEISSGKLQMNHKYETSRVYKTERKTKIPDFLLNVENGKRYI